LLWKYTQLGSRYSSKVKCCTTLHFAACKQSNSHIKIQTLAVSTPIVYSVLGVIGAVVSECKQ